MISYINGEYFFSRRNLWMTDKLDWDASASIKSTLGVIKSSSSSQVKVDASEPSRSHSDPQVCMSGEATGRLGALCPHRSPEPSGHRGLPLLKSPKLKQKLNSETQQSGPGFWLRSFLMRSNSDIRVKNCKVRLCSHLGLIVLWYGRSDEC